MLDRGDETMEHKDASRGDSLRLVERAHGNLHESSQHIVIDGIRSHSHDQWLQHTVPVVHEDLLLLLVQVPHQRRVVQVLVQLVVDLLADGPQLLLKILMVTVLDDIGHRVRERVERPRA